MTEVIKQDTSGNGSDGKILPSALIGLTEMGPAEQLKRLLPVLGGNLGTVSIEKLSLGCDRFPALSEVDRILERAGVYLRQYGYKKIFELADPKIIGGGLFLKCEVYLVNGFDSQNTTIGVAVGNFFKAAIEDEGQIKQIQHWKEEGYDVLHYMAAGKCPKNAKFIVLATMVRKEPE
ncbi:MAG: hypothetical protein MUD10_02490 [Candidatus Pacebacteria bacterium]|jgi:hypothetical protein|nr:hypothetical protein [Candidatus Paceibacterota bacterium]